MLSDMLDVTLAVFLAGFMAGWVGGCITALQILRVKSRRQPSRGGE